MFHFRDLRLDHIIEATLSHTFITAAIPTRRFQQGILVDFGI
jgi:hypothetical protein